MPLLRMSESAFAKLKAKSGMVRNSTIKRKTPLKAKTKLRKKAKAGTVSAAKAEAWRIFSRMIRMRDCLKTTGDPGRGRCVTCGRAYAFKDLQAGHWLGGRRNSVLFDDRHVHCQCFGCNVRGSGKGPEYTEFMEGTYGKEVMAEIRAKNKERRQFGVVELQEMQARWMDNIVTMMKTGRPYQNPVR